MDVKSPWSAVERSNLSGFSEVINMGHGYEVKVLGVNDEFGLQISFLRIIWGGSWTQPCIWGVIWVSVVLFRLIGVALFATRMKWLYRLRNI